MELYNLACCNIYNERPAQKKKIMTTYRILELYNISHYDIYNNHICTFAKPENKRISFPYQSTRESRGSHLHPQGNAKIHLLPKKSIIHCHSQIASNVQRYNPVPLVLWVNSYQLIVWGCTPNVCLIPSRNSNGQNQYISDLPLSTTQSLGKSSHPLRCSHSPSKFPGIPYLGWSIPWQCFLASEDTKPMHIPTSKPSYRS